IGYGIGAAFAQPGRVIRDVELVIIQPRMDHVDGQVRRWRTDALTLLDWAETFAEGAKRTEDPDAPLVTGDHCRWCKAQGICPKIAEAAEIATLDEYKGAVYDPQALSDSLKRIAYLEKWAKATREFALGEATRGRDIPDWKLVEKRAVRTWKDRVAAECALLDDGLTPEQIIEPEALKSPAQIEEIVGKADFGPLVGQHVASISSGLTLAPLKDKRPAVNRDIRS